MMKFITPLILLPKGRNWILGDDFIVQVFFTPDKSDDDVYAITLTIPKGYVTDLASTPKFLWPIFPPFGEWTEAAVVHDFLYDAAHPTELTRRDADYIFFAAMRECGTVLWKAYLMWLAVRVFANPFYRNL